MKRKEISAALTVMKEIKWDKIEDKNLRDDLMSNHFTMFDEQKKLESEIERLKEVILSPYDEEQKKVDSLNQKIQAAETVSEQREFVREILSYEGYNNAVREFNKKVDDLYNQDISGLKKIDRTVFYEEVKKQNFNVSWFEGLYPLFILD